MKGFAAKVNRKGYTETMKALQAMVNAFHLLRNAGEKAGAEYTPAEAVCQEILPILTPECKCRVVVEYDPNEAKVAVYREPLDRVKLYDELLAEHRNLDGAAIWE